MTHAVPHPGTQTAAGDPEPIGRDAELAVLTDAHRDLLGRGRGAVVWLAGEPGIGASTLLRAFVRRCRSSSAAIRTARASSQDTGDLTVLYRLLDPGVRAAAAQATPGPVAHVRALCTAGPTTLILEDLDHADDASLFVWTVLSRSTAELPLLLVSTCRTRPYQERLARMREALRLRGARVAGLRALSEPDMAALGARHLGAPTGPRLTRYLQALGGNPTRALALLTALADAGLIGPAGTRCDLRGHSPRADALLDDAVRGHLPPELGWVLGAAALAGPAFDAIEIGALTGEPMPPVASALAAAVDHAILRTDGTLLAFRHDVVRAAIAGTFSATQRRILHETAAAALLTVGADAATIARHLLDAGPMPAEATRWLLELGDQTLLDDADLFVALLARAAAGTDYLDRVTLSARQAALEHWLGHHDAAARIAYDTAAQANDLVAAALTRLAARAHIRAGRAVAVADRHPDATEPRLVAWHAVALAAADRPEAARQRIQRATAIAGNDVATAATVAHASLRIGGGPVAVDALRRWRDLLSCDIESRELRALLHIDLLDILAQTGPAEMLSAAIDEATVIAASASPLDAAAVHASAERAAYLSGHWSVLAGTGSGIGDLVSARRLRPAGRSTTPRRSGAASAAAPQWWQNETEAIVAEQAGRSEDALHARSTGFLEAVAARPARLHGAEHLMRLALAVGDTATAATVVQRCTEAAAEENLPVQVAVAALVAAMLAGDAAALLRAGEDLRHHGAPLQSAAAFEEAAVRLAAARERTGANHALRDAVVGYSVVGAAWDIARADSRLREHGIRRRAPADRPATGWAALTPAEFRVVRLLARGLSNRDIAAELFLSQNTVQTHLSRIRVKLGLRSRLDIVRAAGGELRP